MVIEHEFLAFDSDKSYFMLQVDDVLITRYLKGVYRENKARFNERHIQSGPFHLISSMQIGFPKINVIGYAKSKQGVIFSFFSR